MMKFLIVAAIALLPVIVFSQDQRTIIIGQNDYHRGLFSKVFSPVRSSFQFVSRIFHKDNFAKRLKNKIMWRGGRYPFAYQRPFVYGNREHIIILPHPVITDRRVIVRDPKDIIILKKNGQTIHITRDGKRI